MDIYYINRIVEEVEVGNAAGEVNTFAANDPYGGLMALLGMSIVFIILFLLYAVFSNTPYLYSPEFKAWLSGLFSRKKETIPQASEIAEPKPNEISGEVSAAIATAIHLYRSEMHDYENTVLTISKVSRTYSPWSSKIYGLRNFHRY